MYYKVAPPSERNELKRSLLSSITKYLCCLLTAFCSLLHLLEKLSNQNQAATFLRFVAMLYLM